MLTDFRLDDDPDTVRLTYQLRAQAGLDGPPASDDDLTFICFGGEDEAKKFGHDVRRRIFRPRRGRRRRRDQGKKR